MVLTGARHGRLVLLPALAPLLAMLGLLPAYALLAGSVRTTAARVWTAVAGMVTLLLWQVSDGLRRQGPTRPVDSHPWLKHGELLPLNRWVRLKVKVSNARNTCYNYM